MITVRGCRFPPDLFYHTGHNVWLRHEAPDTVTLGATSFGVALAIEFLAFIPKRVGTEVEPDRAVGLLELAKTITSVRTPVGGTVIAVNEAAEARPWLINKDPYGAGWLVRLRVADWQDASSKGLITGDKIEAAFEEAMMLENFSGLAVPPSQDAKAS